VINFGNPVSPTYPAFAPGIFLTSALIRHRKKLPL